MNGRRCEELATNDNAYDVAVIGGGPSGLMASLAAVQCGARTILIEKGDKLGRKLGISGGGRCNVTNAKPLAELMQNIPGNGRFLHSALQQFSNEDIVVFFEGLGIQLKEEDRGRVFPVTDKAQSVVQAMVNCVFNAGVEVWTDTPVKRLLHQNGRTLGVELANKNRVYATSVILATGGCSVPKTGSTGDAYPWARQVGHTIVEPYPTEVPLTSNDPRITNRQLQGLSLKNVDMTIKTDQGKRLTTETGDMIFTHFGVSGPAALRCSHYVSTAKRKNSDVLLKLEIDCLPETTTTTLHTMFAASRKSEPRKQLNTWLLRLLPERLLIAILEVAHIEGQTQLANVRQTDFECVARTIKGFYLPITGTLPLAQATVTGGGVHVKEIDPKTMASRICEGLYFCGEVMDVHAHTGGYNITVAFSTGHLAGESAAAYALQSITNDAAGD